MDDSTMSDEQKAMLNQSVIVLDDRFQVLHVAATLGWPTGNNSFQI